MPVNIYVLHPYHLGRLRFHKTLHLTHPKKNLFNFKLKILAGAGGILVIGNHARKHFGTQQAQLVYPLKA